MSLFGDCEDCGQSAQLRHKPDVPMSEQSRPSICSNCRYDREARLEDEYEPLPPRYSDERIETEHVDPTEDDR